MRPLNTGLIRGMSHTNSMWFKIVSIVFYVPFKKKKTFSVFLSSYRNTSGSLGERKMLWEHELRATVSTAFSSSLKLSHVFVYDSIETRSKCFLLHSENSPGKITKNEEHLIALFVIKISILYTAWTKGIVSIFCKRLCVISFSHISLCQF